MPEPIKVLQFRDPEEAMTRTCGMRTPVTDAVRGIRMAWMRHRPIEITSCTK